MRKLLDSGQKEGLDNTVKENVTEAQMASVLASSGGPSARHQPAWVGLN
jgi:hypothetical protein